MITYMTMRVTMTTTPTTTITRTTTMMAAMIGVESTAGAAAVKGVRDVCALDCHAVDLV